MSDDIKKEAPDESEAEEMTVTVSLDDGDVVCAVVTHCFRWMKTVKTPMAKSGSTDTARIPMTPTKNPNWGTSMMTMNSKKSKRHSTSIWIRFSSTN